MKLPKDEFKKLQQHWYQKLSENGFEDIECLHGEEFLLLQSSDYPFRQIDTFTKDIGEEYFRCLGQMVNDDETVYRNETDRRIMTMYAEGLRAKVIASEMGMHRHSIRFIVRRYEMLWGLRRYDAKQLNVKKKA